MRNQESIEKARGARIGVRLAVAVVLTAVIGAYLYLQKSREVQPSLSATEQTIQEQLQQESQQGNPAQIAEAADEQSASVLIAFSATNPEGNPLGADISPAELQILLGEINRILLNPEFARETLDALGDTLGVGSAKPLDSQNFWVMKGEPYLVAAKRLASSMKATGSSESNLIKLTLVSNRPAQLKSILDLHANRLVLKWKSNSQATKTALSNLLAEKEGLEVEISNAVTLEKAALTKSIQDKARQAESSALESQRKKLLDQIKTLEAQVKTLQPAKGSTAYSTHSHRVLIARLQEQQAYLQSQSQLAEANPDMKGSIDSELKQVADQLSRLIEQEKQTQHIAEDLADRQQVDSNAHKLKSLRGELVALDQKMKVASASSPQGDLYNMKNRTEALMTKLETVERRIKEMGTRPEFKFGIELYQ